MGFRPQVFIFLIIIMLATSCTPDKEGVIEYNITYKQTKDDNPLINLMPTTMDFYFKNDKILTQIEGWMGIFKSIQLSNLEDSSNVLMMKLLDKKYYYKRQLSDEPLSFEKLDIKQIDYPDNDTIYKGYNCKCVKVVMNDSLSTTYNLLYTNDIKVVSPNRNNPFDEVPGVLMRFHMNLKGLSLQLEFESYRDTVFPEGTFQIPNDYKEISREEMTNFFNELNAI